ncbi:YqzE family protein [Sporolactobacillus sp. THM19-2]|uniref:YqzE family protein n=1 Tax=Sporolactobacillus sp. THM19-2 TaxID=2511171 RepID=UPI00101F4E35|nr:YqzE family protein [Sporolactobacillus sp. THM19-2]RYL90434.1 YqzE family protein [Sporolactobacillus sp. THM19-2]
MKPEEYVKFLTEQFVRYMERPRAERKQTRQEHREQRLPVRNQLFGQIPNAIENYVARLKPFFSKKR